ncbi:TFIIB-type zinc ribbon-containing protein [Noviherbaspirillum sp.]|uniref:TFIIB-type zinc ribbon-containing protein n=1 Tax=Noviherbaspirillum sp. TaxID=1926288 RepID=UPI002FE0A035
MQCPVCNQVNLVMSERQGIEIDYCPQCRGVWLDRGELDKIIDRSVSAPQVAVPQQPPSYPPQQQPSYPPQQPGYGGQQQPYDSRYHKKKKREGFLGDLFDF